MNFKLFFLIASLIPITSHYAMMKEVVIRNWHDKVMKSSIIQNIAIDNPYNKDDYEKKQSKRRINSNTMLREEDAQKIIQIIEQNDVPIFTQAVKNLYKKDGHVAGKVFYDGPDSNPTYSNLLHYIVSFGGRRCMLKTDEKDKLIHVMIHCLFVYNQFAYKDNKPTIDINEEVHGLSVLAKACLHKYPSVIKKLLSLSELKISDRDVQWASSYYSSGMIKMAESRRAKIVKAEEILKVKKIIKHNEQILYKMLVKKIESTDRYYIQIKNNLDQLNQRDRLLCGINPKAAKKVQKIIERILSEKQVKIKRIL